MSEQGCKTSLTSREEAILELASRGRTDKETAESLGIAKGTVDGHWARIRLRLGVSSRTEAVAVHLERRYAALKACEQLLVAEKAVLERVAAALRESQAVLEAQVTARTAELTLANEKLLAEVADRESAVRALKDSEARFRSIIEDTAAGYFLIDREGLYQAVNAAWLRLHKYDTAQEILGRHFSVTQVQEDRSRAEKVVQVAIARGAGRQGEFTRRCKDGSIGWHTYTVSPVRRGGEVVGIEGFLIDITDRKLAEVKLRESEERYRGLFDNMSEGFAYCRMIFDEGEPADFVYLAVNSAFGTLTGLHDVTGKRATDVIPGIREADPGLFEIYGRVSLTGNPEKLELLVESLQMWFSISVYSPETEYFVAVFDVIGERKETERALIESQTRFQSLFQNSPLQSVYYRLIRDSEGEIADWEVADINADGAASLGHTREELLGRRAVELFGAETMEGYLEICRQVVESGESRQFETTFAHNGHTYLASVFSVDADHYATVSYDITEAAGGRNRFSGVGESIELCVCEPTCDRAVTDEHDVHVPIPPPPQ